MIIEQLRVYGLLAVRLEFEDFVRGTNTWGRLGAGGFGTELLNLSSRRPMLRVLGPEEVRVTIASRC